MLVHSATARHYIVLRRGLFAGVVRDTREKSPLRPKGITWSYIECSHETSVKDKRSEHQIRGCVNVGNRICKSLPCMCVRVQPIPEQTKLRTVDPKRSGTLRFPPSYQKDGALRAIESDFRSPRFLVWGLAVYFSPLSEQDDSTGKVHISINILKTRFLGLALTSSQNIDHKP